MRLKKARQILKSLADDTRLRIINLLNRKELTVTDICKVLNKSQSNVSKHLARLRLTGIVGDKRKGLNVHYYLIEPKEKAHKKLLSAITVGLAEMETFKQDLERLKGFTKKLTKIKLTEKGGVKK
ncbi:MAG: metalloregulator ArsR/SmtB family transcription factor [Candidatus Omnitrophica bacterium]|nr:metalloregulator ArsR/SmtB family transcription factor [Candidatus Omnitrophota bacterium]